VQAFRQAAEAGDVDRLLALMTEDVTLRSPVVHRPYRGRAQVGTILRAVARVFEDLRYEREIGSEDAADHALVFTARVRHWELHGCDLLHTDETGLVDELVVMIRPLSGVLALAEAMREELERTAG
jgi:ketosteroid isomerase-like protein